jgi:probable rRNA maturation factor
MLQKSIPIYFHYLTDPFYLPKRSAIKKFLFSIFEDYSKKVKNINYIFCSDEYLLDLNKEYLNHNYYTDIITFELNTSEDSVEAEIYISIERARINAELYSVSGGHETTRLLIHGALHLCGHKDKTKKEFKKMKALEEHYLNQWFHVKRKKKV